MYHMRCLAESGGAALTLKPDSRFVKGTAALQRNSKINDVATHREAEIKPEVLIH